MATILDRVRAAMRSGVEVAVIASCALAHPEPTAQDTIRATNAAVFLAGGDGQYGLGAYVNYEHARRTVEPMLQRLGDEACPRIADETEILKFEDVADFVADCDLDASVESEMEMEIGREGQRGRERERV